MSAPKSIELIKIINALKSLRTNIIVPTKFHDRMDKIKVLMGNDTTGLVNTVLDFMVHSATVPMKIETNNKTLDQNLTRWQNSLLNKDINIDIPRGLRELSAEYFKERWKSSFVALNVQWGNVKFSDGSTFQVPTRMWFADGSSLSVESEKNSLNTRKYFMGIRSTDRKELKNSTKKSILIRKPFNSLYENFPTPYLVKRGVLFNALLKQAVVTKQADVIEAVIPYLLLLKSGTDKLAELEMLADEDAMKKLKDQLIKATEEHDITGDLGKLVASLNYDVNVEHLIPDLNKLFNADITRAIDKNLLAGLGLIELEGFAKSRQETILNPKVLVEEVTDAVADWASLLEEVMYEMLERNQRKHPKLVNNEIRVVPGKIKAFITDDMRSMLRSMYDRGVISKQTGAEDIADVDFEVEVERREKENSRDLDRKMKPPVIQNLEQFTDPELEDENKQPGSPEADNFNNAVIEGHFGRKHLKKKKKDKKDSDDDKIEITAPFDSIDELPDNVKNVLPVPAQLLFMRVFNEAFEEHKDEERAFRIAWGAVKKQYEKNDDGKWVKKASASDYKDQMTKTAYAIFNDIYNIALAKSDSRTDALETALAVIEKICRKNDNGIWVKDRSVTKAQLKSIDNPDVIDRLLEAELKEKKLKLLDKLLENE